MSITDIKPTICSDNYLKAALVTKKAIRGRAVIDYKEDEVHLWFYASGACVVLSHEFIAELHKTIKEDKEGQGP